MLEPYNLRHKSQSLFQGRETIKNTSNPEQGARCVELSIKVMGAFLSPCSLAWGKSHWPLHLQFSNNDKHPPNSL